MNDTELLNWIAEHLVSFRPVFETATMVWIDNDGFEKEIWYKAAEDEITGNDIPNIKLLRGCIEGALKHESLQHKENI